MNWNPYKRIAALEHKVADLKDELDMQGQTLHDLSVKHNALGKWMVTLEDRLQAIDRQLNPHAAAPMRRKGAPVFTEVEVADAAEQKRIKQREYSKAHYAKKKARAKQNEYQRAYRARKKAAAQAVGGTA